MERLEQTYLDWAATTPLCEEAALAMRPYLDAGPGNIVFGANANSLHTPGRDAFRALEDARALVAHSIGARPDEVIFTSGATEADNAAVLGIISARQRKERQRGNGGYRPHFITSAIEHDAILSVLPVLRERGCDVTVLGVDRDGFVAVEELRRSLRPETALVSVMTANNEVGSIQDIDALCRCAHEAGALFHTDATQALGKVSQDVRHLGVDAASFSAHKVCGPKGVGALFLKAGTPFEPMLHGGGQEIGRRSGTQNVMGAVGFAAACSIAAEMAESERRRLSLLRDMLYRELEGLPGVRASVRCLPGDDRFLPSIVNVTVEGMESETLILQLDLAGFAVSGGSACSSHSLEPSHVLTALGMPRDRALCSLRVSMGRYTQPDDVERFIGAFKQVVGA